VYNFVAVDCSFYVPEYDCVTIYFLKDLMTGKKKCKCNLCIADHFVRNSVIKGKDVRHVSVPQYEGLTIEKIAEFLDGGHQDVY